MSLTNGQTNIAALYSYNILSVPRYQRAYAWESEPHLRNFIEDLREHPTDGEQKYFFGTVLLTRNSSCDVPRFCGYDIVDGQQRLTTAGIFVTVAISILRKDHSLARSADDYFDLFVRKGDVRKFHTVAEDDNFFERFIVGDETATKSACSTPSQKRLLEAKRYFSNALVGLGAPEIDRLILTLWESQILVYAVDSDAKATQIFELQNDRGKRLTSLEALKSYLMHGIYLHAGDSMEKELHFVQSNFADIYRSVEKIEGKFASPDEDQLLSYHCVAFEEWARLEDGSDGWVKPKQLVRQLLLCQPDSKTRVDWIKRFSSRLRDSYSYALEILEIRDAAQSVPTGDLALLRKTAPFWPLLLKCWKYDQEVAFTTATRSLVSFSFRAAIAGKRSDVGESELRRIARDFAGDFDALGVNLDNLKNGWEIPRYFALGLDAKDFYDWGIFATYLLWRYENHLRSQTGQQYPPLSWQSIAEPLAPAVRYAKDHIEPKDPANVNIARTVQWSPDEQPGPFSDLFLHRLGNLVLDTISAGAAKGNGQFQSRISHYTKSTFLSQGEIVCRFAGQDADGNLAWGESSIRTRQRVLMDFALSQM